MKSAVVWLRTHNVVDLPAADLPTTGASTTYLRLWRPTLQQAGERPEDARRSMSIRLAVLRPDLTDTVHLGDVHAPLRLADAPGAQDTLLSRQPALTQTGYPYNG